MNFSRSGISLDPSPRHKLPKAFKRQKAVTEEWEAGVLGRGGWQPHDVFILKSESFAQ